MPEVNRYRDGELSSTKLMQEAMEAAHAVAPGEGRTLEWHKDHETLDQARARMHDEPARAFEIAGTFIASMVAKDIGKAAIANAPRVMSDPAFYAEKAAEGSKWLATFSSARLVVALPYLAGAAIVAAGVGEIKYAVDQGRELHHLSDIDGLEVAVTKLLDLDPAYRMQELAKFPTIASVKTVLFFEDWRGELTEFGREHLPELQAAADAGAREGLESLKYGTDEHIQQNPGLAQRLKDDVAFCKGFENVISIAHHPDNDAKLAALVERLNARRVVNDAAVPVKG